MKEQIEQIEALLESSKKVEPKTPFLSVAIGALETARNNAKEHLAELARQEQAKSKAKPAK